MICKILGAVGVFLLLIVISYGPIACLGIARKIGREYRAMLISGLFALGGISFGCVSVGFSSSTPKWLLVMMIFGYVFLCLLFIFSLAFISLIPEEMEKEAKDGKV